MQQEGPIILSGGLQPRVKINVNKNGTEGILSACTESLGGVTLKYI